MIGLMFMAGIAAWAAVVVYLCKRIPQWLGITRFVKATRYLLFPILFLLPIADELIGRWQFHRLCEREAVVNLSPDWGLVRRASSASESTRPLSGYIVPISVQHEKYFDIDTGKVFLEYKGFHRRGGLIFRRLDFGAGGSKSCWPKNKTKVLIQVNIDEILKSGGSK